MTLIALRSGYAYGDMCMANRKQGLTAAQKLEQVTVAH
ncbi:predicted protein [Sclerotinia sclerotiorum 1980 UF-70]|uniref:Uncharacterized protein n=1 Tax=Sclerotinia sclerotiorum (strain ATCC 18683 / 1980 / Ss-1) TaxID=665079 RepID=A7EII6_SCLS1|nr:predicted protein [Sclerotinia sclerotiorum 1980 UF-70]EDO02652.1 predicted protein [Sclerotinia sclerotiorum 1980 UF-70]